jgi:hypothetical protein
MKRVLCRMRILQWNVCLVSNEDTSMERVSGVERGYFSGMCVWCRMILQWNVCLV